MLQCAPQCLRVSARAFSPVPWPSFKILKTMIHKSKTETQCSKHPQGTECHIANSTERRSPLSLGGEWCWEPDGHRTGRQRLPVHTEGRTGQPHTAPVFRSTLATNRRGQPRKEASRPGTQSGSSIAGTPGKQATGVKGPSDQAQAPRRGRWTDGRQADR